MDRTGMFVITVSLVILAFKASSGYNLERKTGKRAKDRNPTVKKILCLGDSITEGLYNDGLSFHPYTKKLSALLNAQDSTTVYQVENEGVSGETVHGQINKRLPGLLRKHSPLDLVIILGGTNDLNRPNYGKKGNLFAEIKAMHDLVHANKIKTVAVTIPEADESVMPIRRQRWKIWKKVNKEIRRYAKSNRNTILLDLAREIPFHSMSKKMKDIYWDDHLHFTPKGYDKMGKLLFHAIKGKI